MLHAGGYEFTCAMRPCKRHVISWILVIKAPLGSVDEDAASIRAIQDIDGGIRYQQVNHRDIRASHETCFAGWTII